MATFLKLDDSPMFQSQLCSLEQTADDLKDRCQRLYKGCKKFMCRDMLLCHPLGPCGCIVDAYKAALGEACNGDTFFADSLEAFGGGQDDPVSVSIGGPVMSRFITAFRELSTYKELLRSQVEHVLIDRLTHFMTVDLQDAKESRRRFDKAIHVYDQAREKFVSLKKNTRGDIVAELEEDLQNSKSAFEKSRFNLVNALMNVEAKKKHEFLESMSAIMDAHLRYFKLGYELFSEMEPYIHEVLTYAQQSKEQAKVEQDKLAKRIQEFRTQAELDSLLASSKLEPSSVDAVSAFGLSSYKNIEAIIPSTADGEVQTIKQGYLLKRSSNLRGDWKRRFFVLNSQGTLFYYRIKGTKPLGSQSLHFTRSTEHNSGVFGRFRSRHSRAAFNEDVLGCRTVDLRMSTIKMDADDTDLRLCFRIISPLKTYTLQAENEADRMDWTNKLTGAIVSLFNSQFYGQPCPATENLESNKSTGSASCDVQSLDTQIFFEDDLKFIKVNCVSTILREVPGNDLCAECSAPDPDWSSLNLGILLCIECSGVHRNLGVHISKVRSLKLDVKVWEPTILDLFRNLGNAFCNSIWEGLLLLENRRVDETDALVSSISKPSPNDAFYIKEKYIQAKYVEKLLVAKDISVTGTSLASSIWQAVKTNNIREVYRLIVMSDLNIINTTFDEVFDADIYHHADAQDTEFGCHTIENKQHDPASCRRIKDSNEPGNCLQGCSLLHLACYCEDPLMLELLLQFGADINLCDFHGRTPLHHCIASGNTSLAKFLLRRGARRLLKDGGGLSALERAMEMGAITDEELFILLSEC